MGCYESWIYFHWSTDFSLKEFPTAWVWECLYREVLLFHLLGSPAISPGGDTLISWEFLHRVYIVSVSRFTCGEDLVFWFFCQETFLPPQVPCHSPTDVGEQSLFLLHGGAAIRSSQFSAALNSCLVEASAPDPAWLQTHFQAWLRRKKQPRKWKNLQGRGRKEGSAALTKMTNRRSS